LLVHKDLLVFFIKALLNSISLLLLLVILMI